MRPKLLLIDEVAAGLTEQEVNEFIELVRRIRNMGTTIVWIEHVIRTMLTATDRLMALAGGQVLAIGEPQRGDPVARRSSVSTSAPDSRRVPARRADEARRCCA